MEVVKQNLGKVAITVDKNYWDINRYYDRLVIVEVKNEYRTYISRKPVPAGVFITNREFWIPFSSLKEELVANFNAFVNKVNGNETIILQILDNQRSFEQLIAQLQNNINVLNARISSINTSGDNGEPVEIVTIPTFYSGDTQPVVSEIGYSFFDTVLGIPIWWNGVNWVDSTGRNVTRYRVADSYGILPEDIHEGHVGIVSQNDQGTYLFNYKNGQWVGEQLPIGTTVYVTENKRVYKFTGTGWIDRGLLMQ